MKTGYIRFIKLGTFFASKTQEGGGVRPLLNLSGVQRSCRPPMYPPLPRIDKDDFHHEFTGFGCIVSWKNLCSVQSLNCVFRSNVYGPNEFESDLFFNILFFRRYKSNPRIIFKPFRNIINSSILDIFIIPPSCLSLFSLYLISVWGGSALLEYRP